MSYLITALISAAIVHAFHKGWLDTPIAAAVDLVKNWGKKVSTLDEANAAPPASDTERKTALGWIALIAVLGVIALIVAGVYSYKSHKAEVATIVNKPVALPELVKPTIFKRITKKIAPQVVNTPATSATEVVQFQTEQPPAVEVKQPLSAREAAYEKRLNEFDNRLTKGEKP